MTTWAYATVNSSIRKGQVVLTLWLPDQRPQLFDPSKFSLMDIINELESNGWEVLGYERLPVKGKVALGLTTNPTVLLKRSISP
jgi:hypothetical protein